MITVVNQKAIRGTGVQGIYIGRRNREFPTPSPLANRFRIGADGTREEVIAKFRRWLWNELRNRNGAAYRELLRLAHLTLNLEDVTLVCWCKPDFCHGDILADAITFLAKQLIRSYIQARVAGDEPLAALIAQDLPPASSAALDVVFTAFTDDKEREMPDAHLWEPGEFSAVTPEDERFAPYVGQLFHYAVWDETDDVDSSMSTMRGRSATIVSLFEALPPAAAETARIAYNIYLESVEHYCSGAPFERPREAVTALPWIAAATTAHVA